MIVYLEVFGRLIPVYGLLIILGGILANILAFAVINRFKLNYLDFWLLETYAVMGGFFGAKLLYLIVSFDKIDWSRMLEYEYFSLVMKGGFVFYGGFILGITAVIVFGKIHKVDYKLYIDRFICFVPFIHSFGRVGCFLVGCCYGIPYSGFGHVVYSKVSIAAPAGVPLFPVQLVEAICLMILALTLLGLELYKKYRYTTETYLISYGIIRIVLENFRSDDHERGIWFGISTSQWISIVLIGIGFVITVKRVMGNKKK